MRRTSRPSIILFLLALICLTASTAVFSSVASIQSELVLQVGDSQIIECSNATKAAVGDPAVADVVALSTKEILINAKSPGKTVVYVWDNAGRRVTKVIVDPAQLDTGRLCTQIRNEINDDRVKVRGVGNTIILEGTVSREAESSRAESIARAVAEMSIFQGASADEKATASKAVSHPASDSFVVEKVTIPKDDSVSAKVGLRTPKVTNLIQIERPLDEVTSRTMEIATAIRQALHNPAITVRALPGGVVILEGKVGTQCELAAIDQVLSGWVKESKDNKGMVEGSNSTVEHISIVNSVVVDSSIARQIMVRAQIVDINKADAKEFGVDWGKVNFQKSDIPGVTATATVVDQPWSIGQSAFGPFGLFEGGGLKRFDPIGARIRALQQQNKAKVLSEPNLLVLDGREATMLVGGEIPIPVVQNASTTGSSAVSVEYKEFGVRLAIQPNITGSDSIQLRVRPEVSQLDFVNAVQFSGFLIPALKSRRTETMVNIKDGQSLIIGGLIQNDQSKLLKKIPVLGDLPVIGELFRSRDFQNNETELVIIITPQIVNPTAANEVGK